VRGGNDRRAKRRRDGASPKLNQRKVPKVTLLRVWDLVFAMGGKRTPTRPL